MFPPELNNKIYDILVQEAGATEWGGFRSSFLHSFPCSEFRFMGNLGFGGKIRFNHRGNPHDCPVYIDCYREDETPERLAIIEKVNKLLADLFPNMTYIQIRELGQQE